MDHYYPVEKVSGTDYVEVSRRITLNEYRLALEAYLRRQPPSPRWARPTQHLAIWQ